MTRGSSRARPFRRSDKGVSVQGGEGGTDYMQLSFDFAAFVYDELDKLRSKLDNAPDAKAQVLALQAVVAYHRKFPSERRGQVRIDGGEHREAGRGRAMEGRQTSVNIRREGPRPEFRPLEEGADEESE